MENILKGSSWLASEREIWVVFEILNSWLCFVSVMAVLYAITYRIGPYSGILISNMSDHLPHFTGLDILTNHLKLPKYIIKEKQDEASLLSFHNKIEIYLRNTHFPNELTTDPNVTYNLLEKIILSDKENHLKPVKTKLNHYEHKSNLWISMGIINSIKFRNKIYKRLRSTNCDQPVYDTLEKKPTRITITSSKEI